MAILFRSSLLLVFLADFAHVCQFLDFVDGPFDAERGRIYIPPDGDLQLICSTDTPANITWVAATGDVYGPMQAFLNITQVTDRKSILFVRRSDLVAKGILTFGGQFVCQANSTVNGEREKSRGFRFFLGRRPAFSGQSGNVQVKEGEEAELSCSIDTAIEPQPSVVWIFQNSSGDFTLQKIRIDTPPSQNAYVLRLRGHRAESGMYRCQAVNQFGIALSNQIRVIVTYFDESEFGFTIDPPRPKEGELVTFSVNINANPPASSITISKNETIVTSVVNSSQLIHRLTASANLTGDYNATVVHLSDVYRQTDNITILSVPDEGKFKVTASYPNSFIYTWSLGFNGNTPVISVTMCCTANPNTLQNTKCKNSKTTLVDSGVTSDTLDGLMPNTSYFCQLSAANEVGSSESRNVTKIKTQATVPSIPTVTCPLIRKTSITVNWMVASNGGNPIIDYDVKYGNTTSNAIHQCTSKKMFPSGGACTLTHLVNNVQYFIEVIARNSIGSSHPGKTACNTTCTLSLNFLGSSQVDEAKGRVLRFNLSSSECGVVAQATVKRCDKESTLKSTLLSQKSDTEFLVAVAGLKSGTDCITVTVSTKEGYVGAGSFNVTITTNTDSNQSAKVAAAVTCSLLVVLCGGGFGFVIIYKKRKRTKKIMLREQNLGASTSKKWISTNEYVSAGPQKTTEENGYSEMSHSRPEVLPSALSPQYDVPYLDPESDQQMQGREETVQKGEEE